MKTIKIQFLDFYPGFYNDLENDLFVRLLRKHFDVQICDDPDYVIYSSFGESHWNVPDRCVKIFYTGENLAPDFNACDFAIAFEHMQFMDRYFRLPNYLRYNREMLYRMEHKHELPQGWDLKTEKPDFCSFVVSNGRNKFRNEAFAKLGEYKKVDSGGKFMNNVGGPVPDKLAFEGSHKFSICFENGRHPGYTTEKLVQAFAARTVPIYLGDPMVDETFNPSAFVDVTDYACLEDVVDLVKTLDNNDELYLKMLKEPAMLPSAQTVDESLAEFEKWFTDIFKMPLRLAYCRNRIMHGEDYIRKRKWLYILNRNKFTRAVTRRLERLLVR